MSDTTTTPDAATVTPEAPEAPVESFSLEYVKELRSEAAKARTDKKSAVDIAKAALDADWTVKLEEQQAETSRISTDLGDAWIELAKLYAAIDAEVPTKKIRDFAGVLSGTDGSEIASAAEKAKALFGGFKTNDLPTDPSQGSGNGAIPLNGNPILNMLEKAVGLTPSH